MPWIQWARTVFGLHYYFTLFVVSVIDQLLVQEFSNCVSWPTSGSWYNFWWIKKPDKLIAKEESITNPMENETVTCTCFLMSTQLCLGSCWRPGEGKYKAPWLVLIQWTPSFTNAPEVSPPTMEAWVAGKEKLFCNLIKLSGFRWSVFLKPGCHC